MTSHPNSDIDNAYWEKWREHYRSLGKSEEFGLIHKDGIIDPDRWDNATRKILFVLKEPNHQKITTKGGDIRGWYRKPIGRAGVMLRHNLARWAHALRHSLVDNLTYNKSECEDTLLQSAVINLKKVEGGATADMGIVGWYAKQDCELLCDQIESIKPDLIVAGGTFTLLSRTLKLPVNWSKEAVYSSQYQAWVIPMVHPASRLGYNKTLKELHSSAKPCFTTSGEIVKC